MACDLAKKDKAQKRNKRTYKNRRERYTEAGMIPLNFWISPKEKETLTELKNLLHDETKENFTHPEILSLGMNSVIRELKSRKPVIPEDTNVIATPIPVVKKDKAQKRNKRTYKNRRERYTEAGMIPLNFWISPKEKETLTELKNLLRDETKENFTHAEILSLGMNSVIRELKIRKPVIPEDTSVIVTRIFTYSPIRLTA